MAEHAAMARALESLRIRNLRLFLIGNTISNMGEWAQRIGQAWLVLELSESSVLLGFTAALQAAPMVVIGPWAGLLADRRDKLAILRVTQTVSALLALLLAALTAVGAITVAGVMVCAVMLGAVKAFDFPAKQSLVVELVGRGRLVDAVTLNGLAFNAAKSIGPAIGGLLIAAFGIATSFMLNAATYAGLLLAISMMNRHEISFSPRVARAPRQLRGGFKYVVTDPALASTMLLMAIIGLLAFEWQVLLPIFARQLLAGDAGTLGAMFTAMGLGSIAGGLFFTGRLRTEAGSLATAGVVLSVLFALNAMTQALWQALVLLFGVGASSTAVRAVGQSILLGRSLPEMRGRVSALLSIAFLGTTLVGGPLVGAFAELLGVRWTFVSVGFCVLLASVGTFPTLRSHLREENTKAMR